MAYILQNTLLALLEYPGSTLLGVNRMLVDKEYRKLVVANATDPSVKAFWTDEFAKYTDRYAQEATPAIQNKVGQFTSNPLIRNLVGQPKSTFDLRKMMDERKIVIVNLSKGKVGEGNANLLGSMLITKIYLAAMSRADVTERELQKLPNFYLYVDEFQSFANKSFADILSEARKYKLNLILAHQYIEQMEEEVRAAVFGNVGTLAVFRVGAYDAEFLEKEFAPSITAEDLVNLGIYQIYLKLMIDGVTSSPFSAVTIPPIERGPQSFREQVIELSRSAYARPRAVVEEEIRVWHIPVVSPARLPVRLPARSTQAGDTQTGAGGPPKERTETGSGLTRAGEPERTTARMSPPPERHSAPPTERPVPLAPSRPIRVPVAPPPPVSLSTLRPEAKRTQQGTAHLSELRRALSDVLRSAGAPEGVPKQNTQSSPPPTSQSSRSQEATRGAPPALAHHGEIPEDMLRKLLEVESPAVRENNEKKS